MPLPVCTHTPAACNACTPRCAVCAPTAPCRPTMPRVPPCTYAPVGSQCDVRVLITRARLLHVVGRAQHRTVLAPVLRVLDRLHATTLGRVGGPDVVPTPHEQWFSTVRTGRPDDRHVCGASRLTQSLLRARRAADIWRADCIRHGSAAHADCRRRPRPVAAVPSPLRGLGQGPRQALAQTHGTSPTHHTPYAKERFRDSRLVAWMRARRARARIPWKDACAGSHGAGCLC